MMFVDASTRGIHKGSVEWVTENVGNNNPHNNLMPLYGVYRFRRTT